jgi:hypothetical protein
MKGVAETALARPDARLVREIRVIPVRARPNLEAGLPRYLLEVRLAPSDSFRVPGNCLAFGRNSRMKLVRSPLDVDVVLFA